MKILFVFLLSLVLLGMVNASISSLPASFKQGQNIDLPQTCSSCTYNNLTYIQLPDGSILNINDVMTKNGVNYNYTLNGNNTSQIGTYVVNGIGDLDGIETAWNYTFEVKGGSITLLIFVFILFIGLMGYGVKIRNPWISLIGCFGISILGIYTSFNGIGIEKNDLTTVVSYITIAIGVGVGFQAVRDITDL